MSDATVANIYALLAACTREERSLIFRELRREHGIHQFEDVIGAPAEMILEAVNRAPELTRRMLRGVIADAAFRTFVVADLELAGWKDVTPSGNFAFDYKLDDGSGPISVQVKLQRSERATPVVRSGKRFGFPNDVFMVETQKTRTGTDSQEKQTRPYRYGEFDVLAVSMQPSTKKWDRYMYTLSRWLRPGKMQGEMATLQPVAMQPDGFWTDDWLTVTLWLRSDDRGKRMRSTSVARKKPNSLE
jgi:hypothetical protein